MDGLTIRGAKQLLDTGKTTSELRTPQIKPEVPGQGGDSFADSLKAAFNQVNETQKTADRKMEALATGKSNNIAEVMIASEQADISLRLMTQVRNKVLDAYQEIMKMQV